MVSEEKANLVAERFSEAWKIRHGEQEGPREYADSFLKWLRKYRVDTTFLLFQELETFTETEHPVALSDGYPIEWYCRD